MFHRYGFYAVPGASMQTSRTVGHHRLVAELWLESGTIVGEHIANKLASDILDFLPETYGEVYHKKVDPASPIGNGLLAGGEDEALATLCQDN